jgi:hypothetical protein
VWAQNTKSLQDFAGRNALKVDLVDLSQLGTGGASESIRRAVAEGRNVLVFAHRLRRGGLDVGHGEPLDTVWLEDAPDHVDDRLVAWVGCDSALFGLSDPLIDLGLVDFSLTSAEPIESSELFSRLTDLLQAIRDRRDQGRRWMLYPELMKLLDLHGVALEWRTKAQA